MWLGRGSRLGMYAIRAPPKSMTNTEFGGSLFSQFIRKPESLVGPTFSYIKREQEENPVGAFP